MLSCGMTAPAVAAVGLLAHMYSPGFLGAFWMVSDNHQCQHRPAASSGHGFECEAEERTGLKFDSDRDNLVRRVFKPHSKCRPMPGAPVADCSFDREQTVGRPRLLWSSQLQQVFLLV